MEWQEICFKLGAPGNEAGRAEACRLMAEKLTPATPAIARVWLIQQLERIGHGECVEALASAMKDADPLVRESARRALQANPAPEAVAELRDALASATDSNVKIGLINALAARGDQASTAVLVHELQNRDVAVAVAAAHALGKVGGPDTFKQIQCDIPTPPSEDPRLVLAISDACLRWTEKATSGDDKQRIYSMLLEAPHSPRPIRMAALRGLLAVTHHQPGGDEKQAAIILDVLGGNDRDLWSVALKQIGRAHEGTVVKLAAGLAKLSPAAQAALLGVLGVRHSEAALPAVLEAVKSSDAKVRLAALRALGGVGDVSVLPLLLETTFAGGEPAAAARESLETIFAKGTDEILLERMKQATDLAQRRTLIEILDRRMVSAAVPAILTETANKDGSIRHTAYDALSRLATPNDIAAIIQAMLQSKDGGDRYEAERAIVTICNRFAEYDQRAESVLAVYNVANEEEKAALLPLLGLIGGPKAYTLIQAALASSDAKQREVGFSALCNWPNAHAAENLLKIAETAKDTDHRRRALRAFAHVVAIRSDGTSAEVKLPMLRRAMKLADRDEERAMLVERATGVYHVETFHMVAPYLNNPRIAQPACYAIVNLSHHAEIRRPNAAEFFHALDQVIRICKTPWLVDEAKQNKILAQREWVDQEMVKVEAALPKRAAVDTAKAQEALGLHLLHGLPPRCDALGGQDLPAVGPEDRGLRGGH